MTLLESCIDLVKCSVVDYLLAKRKMCSPQNAEDARAGASSRSRAFPDPNLCLPAAGTPPSSGTNADTASVPALFPPPPAGPQIAPPHSVDELILTSCRQTRKRSGCSAQQNKGAGALRIKSRQN